MNILEQNNVTLFDLLVQVLRFGHVAQNVHVYRTNLRARTEEIADQTEIVRLIKGQHGLHFRANHATLEQLECFDLAELGLKMKSIAPLTWQMLATLLDSDNRRQWDVDNHDDDDDTSSDSIASDCDDEFIWDDRDLHELDEPESDGNETSSVVSVAFDEPDSQWETSSQASMDVDLETAVTPVLNVDLGVSTDHEQPKRRRRRKQDRPKRHKQLRKKKQVMILSVLGHSSNQSFNAFQSVLGFFLESKQCPEIILETVAHMGISVSVKSWVHQITSTTTSTWIFPWHILHQITPNSI